MLCRSGPYAGVSVWCAPSQRRVLAGTATTVAPSLSPRTSRLPLATYAITAALAGELVSVVDGRMRNRKSGTSERVDADAQPPIRPEDLRPLATADPPRAINNLGEPFLSRRQRKGPAAAAKVGQLASRPSDLNVPNRLPQRPRAIPYPSRSRLAGIPVVVVSRRLDGPAGRSRQTFSTLRGRAFNPSADPAVLPGVLVCVADAETASKEDPGAVGAPARDAVDSAPRP